jgi:uncharacterized protein YcgI (DUF1989 family)
MSRLLGRHPKRSAANGAVELKNLEGAEWTRWRGSPQQMVLREETIAPADHFAAEIRKDQVLRIIDVKDQQVVELVMIFPSA